MYIMVNNLRTNRNVGWAISSGINRDDISSISDLRGGKIGISRLGR